MLKKKIHRVLIGMALAAAIMVIVAPAYAVDFAISYLLLSSINDNNSNNQRRLCCQDNLGAGVASSG